MSGVRRAVRGSRNLTPWLGVAGSEPTPWLEVAGRKLTPWLGVAGSKPTLWDSQGMWGKGNRSGVVHCG